MNNRRKGSNWEATPVDQVPPSFISAKDYNDLLAKVEELMTYVSSLESKLIEQMGAHFEADLIARDSRVELRFDTAVDQILKHVFDLNARVEAQFQDLLSNSMKIADRRLEETRNELNLHFENRLASLNEALVGHIEKKETELQKHFENRLTSLNELLVSHTETLLTELRDEVRSRGNSSDIKLGRLRREVDDFRAQDMPTLTPGLARHDELRPNEVDSGLYAALEDRFRGSEPSILERQRIYLPELEFLLNGHRPVIDLGCGRGEWLTLLVEEGHMCVGVDSNPVMVARCQELGLVVEFSDLIEYLSALPDTSVGAITMFQVAEHLPISSLLKVFREARRALVDGGILIAEVPNTKNIRVGAGTFWIDPTHQRPIFPEVLEFLAEYVGFETIRSRYLNRLRDQIEPTGLTPEMNTFLLSVMEALDGPADYAIIATV